jgi:hypothetical protein
MWGRDDRHSRDGDVLQVITTSPFSRKHWAILIALVVLQLLSRPVETLIYRMIVRHVLVRYGAQPCVMAGGGAQIADCDFVTERRDGDRNEQTFYSRDGSTKTTRVLIGTAVVSTENVHWGNASRLILPFSAVALAFIATWRKVLRTGAFFTWELARHPWDDREKLLLFYAVPIFLTGLMQLAFIP